MFRGFVFCIAALALLSFGARPANAQGIIQDEGYGIGAGNLLTLVGGCGMVGDAKIAVVSLGQTTIRLCCLWAIQDDNAILTQKAGAVGLCSVLGVWQTGSVIGGQSQFVAGWSGPKAQGQGLEVDLTQGLTKSEGAGAATASHQFIGDSLQTAGSPSGSMSEDRLIDVAQDARIQGLPGSNAGVASGMFVAATQTQVDN